MNKLKLMWSYSKQRTGEIWQDLKDGALLGRTVSRRELIWAMLIVYFLGECQ